EEQAPWETLTPGDGAGGKDLVEVVGAHFFELIVPAVAGLLVGAPANECGAVPEAIPLQMIVLHLADALEPKRLPRKVLAGTPTAFSARRPHGLIALSEPGVILLRIRAERGQLASQLLAPRHRKGGRDADVVQHPIIVIQSKQQRADGVRRVLVPPKAADHAIRCAFVLYLDHPALARLVRLPGRFQNDPVQSSALKLLEPPLTRFAVSCDGSQIDRGRNALQKVLEPSATFFLRLGHEVLPVDGEEIESDERGRRLGRQFLNAGAGGMEAKLQGVEIQAAVHPNDDLSIHHAARRKQFEAGLVYVWKVAIEGPLIAALDVDIRISPEDQRPKAIPLRLDEVIALLRYAPGELSQHRLDGRIEGKRRLFLLLAHRSPCWMDGLMQRKGPDSASVG